MFFYLQLQSVQKCMWNTATGSTIKNLSLESLGTSTFQHQYEITQQKIAAVLSALDAKIELNNRINTELEAMAKTLYDYWFVQFDFPDVNGKPYKSSGGKMVYNEAQASFQRDGGMITLENCRIIFNGFAYAKT